MEKGEGELDGQSSNNILSLVNYLVGILDGWTSYHIITGLFIHKNVNNG